MAKKKKKDVHPDETDEHFHEFIEHVSAESERGAILVIGAWLDELVDRLLREHFVDNGEVAEKLLGISAPLAAFSARIDLCYLIGLISTREHHDLHRIREIRNAAAHFDWKRGDGFNTGFSSGYTQGRVDALQLPSKKFRAAVKDPREVFQSTAGVIWNKLKNQIELTHRVVTAPDDVMFEVQFESDVFIQMSHWMVQGRARKAVAEKVGRMAMQIPESSARDAVSRAKHDAAPVRPKREPE